MPDEQNTDRQRRSTTRRRLPVELLEMIHNHIPNGAPFSQFNFATTLLQQQTDYAIDHILFNDGEIKRDEVKLFREQMLETYLKAFDDAFLVYAITKNALKYLSDWEHVLNMDAMLHLLTLAVAENDMDLADGICTNDYWVILYASDNNFLPHQPSHVHQYLVDRYFREIEPTGPTERQLDFVLRVNELDEEDLALMDKLNRKDSDHFLNPNYVTYDVGSFDDWNTFIFVSDLLYNAFISSQP